jgi:hypothetical protein
VEYSLCGARKSSNAKASYFGHMRNSHDSTQTATHRENTRGT